MYETFSKDYDRFVNWQNRLAYELPFIQDQLQSVNAKRVLDAATGTGMHAIALAKRGYQVNLVNWKSCITHLKMFGKTKSWLNHLTQFYVWVIHSLTFYPYRS